MSNFVIISDTGCDLSKEMREKFGVVDYLHGVLYCPDGSEKLADLDWTDITPEQYFSSMKSKKHLYKTSCPTLGETQEIFEKHLNAGKDILCICISSALSCTYQNCVNVANELQTKYPDRKIICIDSLRYSTSLALLISLAGEKQKQGATLDDTASYIEEIKHNVHQMGFMDDLFFLCRTGRISNFKAFFGSLVGINAFADFNENGLSEVLGKVKGKKMAMEVALNYIENTIVNPKEQVIFISHSNRLEHAKIYAEMIKERFNPKDILLTDVGMQCGANIGPGLCAAFYLGTPISKDNQLEKALMTELISK